jgi:hypothetical protein
MGSRITVLAGCLLTAGSVAADSVPSAGYVVLQPVGCNATSLAQVPDSTEFFLGRQLLTAEGQIAGITGPNDCSGGIPENAKAGKIFNRWALTLSKLDWGTHQLTLTKVLIDTSIDPATHLSRAILTSGAMKGAVIRSAYDPDIVRFHGDYLVSYECTLENGKPFGVEGSSSCISFYDPRLQAIDLGRTLVIISGAQVSATKFNAAAVPEMLVYRDRLFIYWSALSINSGQFTQLDIRGAELLVIDGNVAVKQAGGGLVRSLDEPATTQVWAVDPSEPLSNTTADLRALWVAKDSLVVAASLGGQGCTSPSGTAPGCFRLALVTADEALARNGFGRGHRVATDSLPSNAQEYTRPIRDPTGAYWLIGHFMRPIANQPDRRSMPDSEFWRQSKAESVLVMFPFPDKSLWPATR